MELFPGAVDQDCIARMKLSVGQFPVVSRAILVDRKCRYFFGARAVRDLFLVDEMKVLENKLPDFAYIPALSDPQEEDNWTGDTGLITEVVGKHVEDASEAEA